MLIGRLAGGPCREANEAAKEADGTGDAKRAIDACLLSGPGEVDRYDEAGMGDDRCGFNEEPSPFSAIMEMKFAGFPLKTSDYWETGNLGRSGQRLLWEEPRLWKYD